MSLNQSNLNCNSSTSYLNATGKIIYGMTNDYMFRAILQTHNNVLKGLIAALLHLPVSEIKNVEITNPIKLGEAIDAKEFIMDIDVMLNNNTLINLEMQVVNQHNWTDRSLSYMCRSFDQLYQGQEYIEALPVIHIGFLDFQLFEGHAEFFGIYKFLNVKDHHLFSDKLTLGVVDLNQIDLATAEDKAYQIDYWARLFKATTWEELKMIAERNEFMQEASQAMYEFTADDMIRKQCRAREEYNRRERTWERDNAALKAALNDALSELEKVQNENAELKALLKQKD